MKRPIANLCAFPDETDETVNQKDIVRANIARVRSVKPKTRTTILPILTAVLALFITITSQSPISTEPFVITRFKSAPGFYFEKSSDVYMNTLQNEFDTHGENLNNAKQFCYRKALPDSGCRSVVTQLNSKLEILGAKNLRPFSNKRTKRSIPTLHAIGDISGDLFGTLGSNFEKSYNDDLSLINKNQDHLLALLRNHKSLFDSLLNFIKQEESERKKQMAAFHDFANQISNKSQLLEKESDIQHFMVYLTLAISDYEHQQRAIFNA